MTGKEGYPTWAYDCAVSHNKQFLEVCGPFRGATNDKTMVRDSALVKRLKEDPLLVGHQYHGLRIGCLARLEHVHKALLTPVVPARGHHANAMGGGFGAKHAVAGAAPRRVGQHSADAAGLVVGPGPHQHGFDPPAVLERDPK